MMPIFRILSRGYLRGMISKNLFFGAAFLLPLTKYYHR